MIVNTGIFWRSWLALLMAMSCCLCLAQDPVFSQFYAAPLRMNPALAGHSEGTNVALNYRNQWPGIGQAYVTYAASADQYVPTLKSGFGISLLADDAGMGLYRTTSATLMYAYQVRLNRRLRLRMGLEAGWISAVVDWNKLIFPDQLHPEFGHISPGGLPFPTGEVPPEAGTNAHAPDVGLGLVVFNEVFYAGLSVKHLNSPGLSFYNIGNESAPGLPPIVTLHVGAEIGMFRLGKKGDVFAAPNMQIVRQGTLQQVNVGTIFRYFKVGTGLWYRHSGWNPDSVIFMIEGRHDQFKIGYSYDLSLSRLSRSGGVHEISVLMNLKGQPLESRYNDCFNLFR